MLALLSVRGDLEAVPTLKTNGREGELVGARPSALEDYDPRPVGHAAYGCCWSRRSY